MAARCKFRPTFNTTGEIKGLYCSEHKTAGMVDIKHKTCTQPGCKTIPIYNVESETRALYCSAHKQTRMVNVINKTCKTYMCSTQVVRRYEGYCMRCFINVLPDKPVITRNYKTKEIAVVLTWINDKGIQMIVRRIEDRIYLWTWDITY